MSNGLYDKMVAAGVDVSWYDKAPKKIGHNKGLTPLHNTACGRLSIYLLEPSGKLFTTTSEGTAYMLARETNNKPKAARFVCACCSRQFATYDEAAAHYE